MLLPSVLCSNRPSNDLHCIHCINSARPGIKWVIRLDYYICMPVSVIQPKYQHFHLIPCTCWEAVKLVLFTTRGLNKAVDVEVRMLTYASPHHIQLLADLFASVSQLCIPSAVKF